MRKNLKLVSLFFAVSALLAGCGGKNDDQSTQPSTKVQLFDQSVVGAWLPISADGSTYEFYSATIDEPYTGEKTGRVYSSGALKNFFNWEIQTNGSIKMKQYSPSCTSRPLSRCAVASTATIVATGESMQLAHWRIDYDDNADGVVDRSNADFYTRNDLDLSSMPEGEFFLSRHDLFQYTHSAKISGKKISIRLFDQAQPMFITADIEAGRRASIKFASNQANPTVFKESFAVPGVGNIQLPVKMWVDNAELRASRNDGFILEYELFRKIQLPGPVPPGMQAAIANYEKGQKKSRSLGLINKFVQGTVIRSGDKFNTFMLFDFNLDWVNGPAGNVIEFTSGTEGILSHIDIHKGKHSERRNFKWVQRADGELALTFENNMDATIRFTKAIAGGYQVLFKVKHPTLGYQYAVHDLVAETPSAIAEKDVPGRYSFISFDGITTNMITLHKDKTVTGIAGGFWFMDTNGDVVSYECKDLQGKQSTTSYAVCDGEFDGNHSNLSMAHIRRLRFMHKDGNSYQVKYDSAVWGADFSTVGPDYTTAAWTYRWTRLGDE